MQQKTQKKLLIIFRVVLVILICLTLYYIWGNSMKSKGESSEQSGNFYVEVVQPVSEAVTGDPEAISEAFTRKLAHFTEYFVLGLEVALLIGSFYNYKIKYIAFYLPIGFIPSSIDEIIQIFSNRGPRVLDVLIDFGGFLLANLLLFVLIYVIGKIRKKKAKVKS